PCITVIYSLSLHDALPIYDADLKNFLAIYATTKLASVIPTKSTFDHVSIEASLPNSIPFAHEWTIKHFRDVCNTEITGYPELQRSEEHTSELQSRFDLVCR